MEIKTKLRPKNPNESIKKLTPILKKRNKSIKYDAIRVEDSLKSKKLRRKKKSANAVQSLESIVKEARVRMIDARRIHRLQNNYQPVKVLEENKHPVLFVVRNSRHPPSNKAIKILEKLQITGHFYGTFVPNTTDYISLLRLIDPFVFYGFLSPENIRHIIFKKLHLKPLNESSGINLEDQNDFTACVDNLMVEKRFGNLGILCISDIVEELSKCKSHFDHILMNIEPFKLLVAKNIRGLAINILESGHLKASINKIVNDLI